MKVTLVFSDWRQIGIGPSIYNTELGFALSLGDLHSGTTFHGELTLPDNLDIEAEIQEAMKRDRAYPVFDIIAEVKPRKRRNHNERV